MKLVAIKRAGGRAPEYEDLMVGLFPRLEQWCSFARKIKSSRK